MNDDSMNNIWSTIKSTVVLVEVLDVREAANTPENMHVKRN